MIQYLKALDGSVVEVEADPLADAKKQLAKAVNVLHLKIDEAEHLQQRIAITGILLKDPGHSWDMRICDLLNQCKSMTRTISTHTLDKPEEVQALLSTVIEALKTIEHSQAEMASIASIQLDKGMTVHGF
ncbi:MAG: hypothetical protein MI808_21995 [Pseudomonadales bacterium]|nr:hypothetical protein [Pseudomonadales bacterium]